MEKFTLINKARTRIKVFEPIEDTKHFSIINTILISYGCDFKSSSMPVMKGSSVESIEEARKEYKKLFKEGLRKTYRFNSFLMFSTYFTSNLTLLNINC